MASPEAETSPPSTPTTTASCPTPRPLATSPTMNAELLRAARSGDERRLVKALLADPSAPDLEVAATAGGNTLLHVASAGGHAELASLLLRRAPRLLAARNAALDTPFHLAARAGAHKVVALLVASSSSSSPASSLCALTRATNRRGETALHDAVRGGHEAAARALAAADLGLVGLCGGAVESPLYMAAAAGSLGMVRVLLRTYRSAEEEKVVPVLGSCTGPGGRTVLHAAVLTSNEMTQELVQWNPTLVKQVDDSGSTPLHYIASVGNISTMKLLLRHDTSSAYVSDSNGLFPVHIAAKMGNGQLIYELCRYCPDCDELLDSRGRNFLHIAVAHKKWKVVWHFCGTAELGRMANVMDSEGNTPLHLAVKNADQMIVSLLMATTVVLPNIVNNQGLTALDLAVLATDKGISYTLNPQVIILRCLAWTGAVLSPRRLDHFIDEFSIGKTSGNELKKFTNISQNLIVGSVLVSTVTFAALFTLPGGYISDGHPHAGAPILSHRYTFKAFVMANTLAFVGSTLSTIWLTYAGSEHVHPLLRAIYMFLSVISMEQATRSMVLGFALGAYVVLSPVSDRIAIVVCLCTFTTLLLRNPSSWQLWFLIMPIKRRLGWRGAFKTHLPQETRGRITVGIGSNFARLFLRRMLGMVFTYSFIFLLALL
ncbi:protein ACCELERATED CELL DEATH 6-like isoform X1 [Phragmites australis]|uniref:protein ACCELERATED CELL DEATH 6-like isoform X1 n=1 Tax=Phragmites australis TaxID=29695 RepID=UPI002D79CBA5|nr:protein ACCELERATED CELL DEATH 6-like isoform X1 [Phragmites australis]